MPLPRAVRRRPRLLVACVGLVVVFVGLLAWRWRLPDPVPLEYGPDTTVIDAPLDEAGFPDYRKHLERLRGPLPPVADNAAPELLDLLTDLDDEATPWPAAFGERPEGPRAVAVEAALDDPDRRDLFPIALDGDPDRSGWTDEDHADLERVLRANRPAIARFVAATTRPSCRMPPESISPEMQRLPEFVPLPTYPLLEFTKLVLADALSAARDDRLGDALERVQAVRRLARLLRRDADTDLSRLVAVSLEESSLETIDAIGRLPDLSAADASRLLAAHRAFVELPAPGVAPEILDRLRAAAFTLEFARNMDHETSPGGAPRWKAVDVNAALRAALAHDPSEERTPGSQPAAWAGPLIRLVLGGEALRDHNTRLLIYLGRFGIASVGETERNALRDVEARRRLLALLLADRLHPDDPAAGVRGDEDVDPWTGRPFLDGGADGALQRWSAGPNGEDDGGTGDDVTLTWESN